MNEIILLMGYPASGKSTEAAKLIQAGYHRLNRDLDGGALADLVPKLRKLLVSSPVGVVLDNTYPTIESRAAIIALAREFGRPVIARVMATTIEEAQFNASLRMLDKTGKLLGAHEIPRNEPNVFPSTVLFAYRKQYQPPTIAEGFTKVESIPFVRRPNGFTNRAIILDFDGTLRRTKSGEKYPTRKDDIEILPGRFALLRKLQAQGYILCGASNQSAVSKGIITVTQVQELFRETNRLLGFKPDEIDVSFCPHAPAPISCFCRKPMPGMGVQFIQRYKLDAPHCVMVGDLKTDATFASRAGFRFAPADQFFASPSTFLG